LPKAGPWDARSAMSSLSPCAEGIIARSIAGAMSKLGGDRSASIPLPSPERYGWKPIL